MSYAATVVNVMIASPSDVAPAREVIKTVVRDWNAVNSQHRAIVLVPVEWETHAAPTMGDRPQEIINEQALERCDLLVAVFWTRIGTPTGEADSGTVEEIKKHVAAGKPAMIYFSREPVHPDSVDDAQYDALKKFRRECEERGLYDTFESLQEFREKFARHLGHTVLREFDRPARDKSESQAAGASGGSSWVMPVSSVPAMSEAARELLLEAAQDKSGSILRVRSGQGTMVSTNGREFVKRGNPRSEATWEGAVDELEELGLIQDRAHKREVYALTKAGYDVADALREAFGALPRLVD